MKTVTNLDYLITHIKVDGPMYPQMYLEKTWELLFADAEERCALLSDDLGIVTRKQYLKTDEYHRLLSERAYGEAALMLLPVDHEVTRISLEFGTSKVSICRTDTDNFSHAVSGPTLWIAICLVVLEYERKAMQAAMEVRKQADRVHAEQSEL